MSKKSEKNHEVCNGYWPHGAGKSTLMRNLPKPQGNFVLPNNVPDMLLDYACELNNLMFYEIDAPTATGKMWLDWLKVECPNCRRKWT